ncbi:hypothetical protein LTR84_008962 [Exophiala bonariae]|uniref:Uncharacterized protein n=1 Tax=Exophiala bonariae TaxID=1690606 RepID=A0AAV9MWH3_9EURO|nr:hypothetical protein LTR84_008962 [Exophiala bonariae]
MLKLRYSVTCNDTRLGYPLWVALTDSISWIRSFPSIYDLDIQVKLEDPWPDLADLIRQNSDRMATSDMPDDSDDPLDVAHTTPAPGSGSTLDHTQPIDFDSLVLDLEIDLRLLRVKRLRTLRLTNAIIKVSEFLQIVCMHPHGSEWQLSIHLAETVILYYGLPATIFLDLLAQLNVRLYYEPVQTYHYMILPLGDYRVVPIYSYSAGQTRISRWQSLRLGHDCWGEPDGPCMMPSHGKSKFTNITTEFRSYILDFTSFVLSYKTHASPEPNSNITLTYEMRMKDSRIICGWVIGAPPLDYERTPGPSQTILPISTIRVFFDLSDFPGEYAEVEDY